MHRSSVPNRAANSRSPAIRSPRYRLELCYRRARPTARTFREPALPRQGYQGNLIGAGAAQERGVVGETPNLAARLQALARPGTLVVADSTRRQIGTLFEIEDLGPQPLAGFAEPQRASRIIRDSRVVSRFQGLRSGATPL